MRTMSGLKQLGIVCPQCGRPLRVLTRQEPAPTVAGRERGPTDRPGTRVEVPIGTPICPVGHMYRRAAGEPYPN